MYIRKIKHCLKVLQKKNKIVIVTSLAGQSLDNLEIQNGKLHIHKSYMKAMEHLGQNQDKI